MQQNFWERGNVTRMNFREHLNLFLGNKGTCTAPPPGRPSFSIERQLSEDNGFEESGSWKNICFTYSWRNLSFKYVVLFDSPLMCYKLVQYGTSEP